MEVPNIIYDAINLTITSTPDPNNNNNTNDDDGSSTISMDKFYPALVQCFGIILCGYFAGRLKIISNHETKGLNTFVGTFALPSLIFLSLVELNWKTVNWNFLLSILISKAIVFLIVIFVSLLITRPINYGRAGLLAIFCTQSNDFAIGFPIVEALYSTTHPEYASYIYLLAPISLAILNPIGYILLEVQKKIDEKHEPINITAAPVCPGAQQTNQTNRFFRNKKCLNVLKTVKSIFFNPMLLMTILGIIGGIIFPNGLPEVFSGVLRVLGNSFSATALFLLGLRIVGQGNSFAGSGFLTPGILILIKLLVFPLVTRQTVNILQAGGNFSVTTELSTFGFLYGTFPAAPGAFVIAAQYNSDVDLIARSMVACTFISAPLMFISAKMISLTNLNPSDYMNELDRFALDISIAGIIGCIWVLLLFSLTKKIKLMPHRITCCLVFSQLLCCIGIILWCKMENIPKWVAYIEFCLFNIGTYSSRLWTALLAITLLFLQCRSLCFVLKMWPYMVLFAWGTPAVISGILIAFDNNLTSNTKRNPSFQYGNAQAAIAVFLLVMCFIVTAGCLVLHQRYKKRFEKYLTLSRELSNPESETQNIRTNSTANLVQNEIINNGSIRQRNINSGLSSDDDENTDFNSDCGNGNGCCSSGTNTTTVVDIEDLLSNKTVIPNNNKTETNSTDNNSVSDMITNRRPTMCSPLFSCPSTSRQNCQNLVQQYEESKRKGLEPLEYPNDIDEHQTLKHTVLLILLLCSMFVGLAVSIWTLVMEGMSGIYLELSFLDAFLNFGQGLIVSAVFITDANEILSPFIKYWRKIWYGANIVSLPNWDDLSSETKHLCEQFRNHHLENCKKDIAKDKRWRIKIYRKVFYGTDFVNWLLEYGLARDRIEATHYARHLLDGRVMRHINNVHHFHDRNLLYTFCNRI